jgi:hypothetical protein
VLEEQEQIFGEEKCPKVTYANLQEMKYLENVIKEALRLYSPVPLFGRRIDQDVEYGRSGSSKYWQDLTFLFRWEDYSQRSRNYSLFTRNSHES